MNTPPRESNFSDEWLRMPKTSQTYKKLKDSKRSGLPRSCETKNCRQSSFIRRHLFAPAGAQNNWDWDAAPRARPGQREHRTKSGFAALLHRASTSLPKSGPRPPPSPPNGGGESLATEGWRTSGLEVVTAEYTARREGNTVTTTSPRWCQPGEG
jgi:hypothetical protein